MEPPRSSDKGPLKAGDCPRISSAIPERGLPRGWRIVSGLLAGRYVLKWKGVHQAVIA